MGSAWQLRPAGLDDLPALVGVFRAEDLKYRGRSEFNLTRARERVSTDPNFDVQRDQIVAEAGGEVVGAAIINPVTLTVAVHPDHDRDGLRADLLAWGERRQAELGRTPYTVAIPAANTAATALFRASGYRLERFYATMVRDFARTGPPEPAVVPAGYRLRAIDRRADLEALHALDDRAFRELRDYHPETLQEYDARHISAGAFEPAWSLLAETEAGEPAGSLLGEHSVERPRGYVAVLAVDPDHRRRGIARALLLAAFAAIHAAGLATAELHVASDNPRALDLYLGVGMTEGERFEHYVRDPIWGPDFGGHVGRQNHP